MSLVEGGNRLIIAAANPPSNDSLAPSKFSFSSDEHLLAGIRQTRIYDEIVLGKTFDEFFAKKFKIQKAKILNPHLEEQKKKSAFIDYQDLFNAKLEDEKGSLWSLYNNGLNGGSLSSTEKPLLILGKDDLRTGKMIQNFGGLNDIESGCIFNGKWDLLRNDLMILSAVHAQKTVMLYLPDGLNEGLFWNEKNNIPSMLAREIVILSAAGYTLLEHPYSETLGYTLTCTDTKKASHFTLEDVAKSSQNANKTHDIMRVFHKSQAYLKL